MWNVNNNVEGIKRERGGGTESEIMRFRVRNKVGYLCRNVCKELVVCYSETWEFV